MQKLMNAILRNEGFIPYTIENHQKILRKRDMWFRKSVVLFLLSHNITFFFLDSSGPLRSSEYFIYGVLRTVVQWKRREAEGKRR